MNELTNKSPMKLGQILDISINFIFKNILWIMLLGVMISLQNFILPELSSDAELGDTYESLIYKLTSGGISFLLLPILAATISLNLADQYFGRKQPWYQAFFKCLKKIVPLLLLQVLSGLLAFLGTLCFIIPGVIVLCAVSVSIPVMMIEDLKVSDSISRSFELTKGNRWRIFGYYILNNFIISVASGILTAVGLSFGISLNYVIMINTVILAPFNALLPAICTLLYFDLRIRKEAMDIEEEVDAIDVEAPELA